MKASILALLLGLTGVYAQAQPMARLTYECDQKHGHRDANIYWTGDDFYICFMRRGGPEAAAPVEDYCKKKVWSEDWDRKDDMIRIDFKRGWTFEGDKHSGVLWNDDTSYICKRPHGPTES